MVEAAEHVFGGERFPLVQLVTHRSRHSLRRSRPRRIRLLTVPSGHVETLRQLGMGVAEGVGQQNAVALALLELAQAMAERARLAAEDDAIERVRPIAAWILDLVDRIERQLGPTAASPVERAVARHRDHPGHGRPFVRPVVGGVLPDAQIHLLQHLARLLAIAQDTQHDAEQLRAARRVEVGERALIARRGAIEEVGERRRLGLGVIRHRCARALACGAPADRLSTLKP